MARDLASDLEKAEAMAVSDARKATRRMAEAESAFRSATDEYDKAALDVKAASRQLTKAERVATKAAHDKDMAISPESTTTLS